MKIENARAILKDIARDDMTGLEIAMVTVIRNLEARLAAAEAKIAKLTKEAA